MYYFLLFKWEAEVTEIRFRCFFIFSRGYHGDRHAKDVFDVLIGRLGEDRVLFDAERVVAHLVYGRSDKTFKVLGARKRDVHKAVEEISSTLAAQGYLVAYLISDASFVGGNGFLCGARSRLLAGNFGETVGNQLHFTFVFEHLADADRDNHLFNMGRLHAVSPPKIFFECFKRGSGAGNRREG